MAQVTYKVVISGMVQGVGFRATMASVAQSNAVRGWVMNRDDGVVLSVLQGDEQDVEKVLKWAEKGPSLAKVTAVTKERLKTYPPQKGFNIVD